jgi:hypothetical protein
MECVVESLAKKVLNGATPTESAFSQSSNRRLRLRGIDIIFSFFVRGGLTLRSIIRLYIVCSLRWSAQTGREGDLVAVVMARSDAGKTP